MRSPNELLSQGREVQSARSVATAEHLAKKYGIKDLPLLSYLSSLCFLVFFPWENIVKNLITLWRATFKDIHTR